MLYNYSGIRKLVRVDQIKSKMCLNPSRIIFGRLNLLSYAATATELAKLDQFFQPKVLKGPEKSSSQEKFKAFCRFRAISDHSEDIFDAGQQPFVLIHKLRMSNIKDVLA